MSAFFIATSEVLNLDKFQQYGQLAGKSISGYDGELVLKGKKDSVITEINPQHHNPHQAVGVIAFPSMELLNNWYNSAEYQALIPLREEAVKMTITTYSVPN